MNDLVKKIEAVSNSLLTTNIRREFEKNYIETLVRMNPDLPPRYLIDFIHKAQLTGANPALNQIHLTTYFNKRLGHSVGTPVFSYHFFLNVANQTGEYDGIQVDSKKEIVFNPVTGKDVEQLVATAKVKRRNKEEVIFKARWSEFFNQNNPMWRDKPYIMLEKTAIANALRWAFPEALSGMYISEEISGKHAETSFNKKDDQVIEVKSKPVKTEIKEDKKIDDNLKVRLELESKILALCSELTKGITNNLDKAEWMNNNLGIDSWSEIKNKDELQLKAIFEGLEKMKKLTPKSVKETTFKIDD